MKRLKRLVRDLFCTGDMQAEKPGTGSGGANKSSPMDLCDGGNDAGAGASSS